MATKSFGAKLTFHIDWDRLLGASKASSPSSGKRGKKKRTTMSLACLSSHVTEEKKKVAVSTLKTHHARIRMDERKVDKVELEGLPIVWMREKPRRHLDGSNRFSVLGDDDDEEIRMIGRATLENGVRVRIVAVDKLVPGKAQRKRIIVTVHHLPSEFETDLVFFGDGGRKSFVAMRDAVRDRVTRGSITEFLTSHINEDAANGVSHAMMKNTILTGQSTAGVDGLPYIMWSKRLRSPINGKEGTVKILTLSGLDGAGTRAKSVFIVQCWFNTGSYVTTHC